MCELRESFGVVMDAVGRQCPARFRRRAPFLALPLACAGLVVLGLVFSAVATAQSAPTDFIGIEIDRDTVVERDSQFEVTEGSTFTLRLRRVGGTEASTATIVIALLYEYELAEDNVPNTPLVAVSEVGQVTVFEKGSLDRVETIDVSVPADTDWDAHTRLTISLFGPNYDPSSGWNPQIEFIEGRDRVTLLLRDDDLPDENMGLSDLGPVDSPFVGTDNLDLNNLALVREDSGAARSVIRVRTADAQRPHRGVGNIRHQSYLADSGTSPGTRNAQAEDFTATVQNLGFGEFDFRPRRVDGKQIWEAVKIAAVPIVDDKEVEPPEIFDTTVEPTPGLSNKLSLDHVDGQFLILDDDALEVEVSILAGAERVLQEGDSAVFTLMRDTTVSTLDVDVMVETRVAEVDAPDGSPVVAFEPFPQVRFEEGEATTRLEVAITEDEDWQAHTSLTVTVVPNLYELRQPDGDRGEIFTNLATGYKVSATMGSATVRVEDDDLPKDITVSFVRAGRGDNATTLAGSLLWREDAGDLSISIRARTADGQRPHGETILVNYTTTGSRDRAPGVGFATEGEDFLAIQQEVGFEESDFSPRELRGNRIWEAEKLVTVAILNDDEVELPEVFLGTLERTPHTSARVQIDQEDHWVWILDDDVLGEVSIEAGAGVVEGSPAVFTLMRDTTVSTLDVDVMVSTQVAEIDAPEGSPGVAFDPFPVSVRFEDGEATTRLEITSSGDEDWQAHTSLTVTVLTGGLYRITQPDRAGSRVFTDPTTGYRPSTTMGSATALMRDDDLPDTGVFIEFRDTSSHDGRGEAITPREDSGEVLVWARARTQDGRRPHQRIGLRLSTDTLDAVGRAVEAMDGVDYVGINVLVNQANMVFSESDFRLMDGVWIGDSNVAIEILDDELAEGDEIFFVTLERSLGLSTLVTRGQTDGYVRIIDDDGPGVSSAVTVSAEEDSITEGSTAVFVLTRLGTAMALDVNVSVSTRVAEVGAPAGSPGVGFPDSFPVSVRFNPGEATTRLEIASRDDRDWQAHTSVTVTVLPGSDYEISPTMSSATVRVEDNDLPDTGVFIEFRDTDSHDVRGEGITPREDSGEVLVWARARTQDGRRPHQGIGIRLSTGSLEAAHLGVEAVDGVDYVRVHVEIDEVNMVFSESDFRLMDGVWIGDSNVAIEILDDELAEGDERFFVTLERSLGLSTLVTLGQTDGFVRIIDDDDPGVSAVTVSAEEDSITEGSTAVFVLTRPGSSLALDVNVSVSTAVAEVGAPAGSPGVGLPGRSFPEMETVRFAAMSDTARLEIASRNDRDWQAHTSVTVTVLPGSDYEISPTMSSATVLVEDNDLPDGIRFGLAEQTDRMHDRLDRAGLLVGEGEGVARAHFRALTRDGRRPHGSQALEGRFATDEDHPSIDPAQFPRTGQATDGEDFIGVDRTVSIRPADFDERVASGDGDVWEAVVLAAEIPIVDDGLDELPEVFRTTFEETFSLVGLVRAGKVVVVGGWKNGIVAIIDDDGPGVSSAVTVSAEEDSITEGSTAVFVLTRLGSSLALDVNVSVSTRVAEVGAPAGSPGVGFPDSFPVSVRFNPGEATTRLEITSRDDQDWQAHTTVRVTVLPGEDYEPSAATYSATVLIRDDDLSSEPALAFLPGSRTVEVFEDAGAIPIPYGVRTGDARRPHRALRLTLNSVSGTARAEEDYQVLSEQVEVEPGDWRSVSSGNMLVWEVLGSVEVLILDDDGEVDTTERFFVTLDRGAGSSLLNIDDARSFYNIDILNDDEASLAYEKGPGADPIEMGSETALRDADNWVPIDPGATVTSDAGDTIELIIVELAVGNYDASGVLGENDPVFTAHRSTELVTVGRGLGVATPGTRSNATSYAGMISSLAPTVTGLDTVGLGDPLAADVGLVYYRYDSPYLAASTVREIIRGLTAGLTADDRDVGGQSSLRVTLVPPAGAANRNAVRQEYRLRITPVNDPPEATELFSAGAVVSSATETADVQTLPAIRILEDVSAVETGQSAQVSSSRTTLSGDYPSNVSDADELLALAPTVSGRGVDVVITVQPGKYGAVDFWVRLSDDGGTANGGDDSTDFGPYRIRVAPVDNPPQFELASDVVSVDEGASFFTVGIEGADNGEGDPGIAESLANGSAKVRVEVFETKFFDFEERVRGRGLLRLDFAGAELVDASSMIRVGIAPGQEDANGEWRVRVTVEENDDEPMGLADGSVERVNRTTTRELVLVIEPVNDRPRMFWLDENGDPGEGLPDPLPVTAGSSPLPMGIADPDLEAKEAGLAPVNKQGLAGYGPGSTLVLFVTGDTPVEGDDAAAIDIGLVDALREGGPGLRNPSVVITRSAVDSLSLEFRSFPGFNSRFDFTRTTVTGVSSGENRQRLEGRFLKTGGTDSQLILEQVVDFVLAGAFEVTVDASDGSTREDRVVRAFFEDPGNEGINRLTIIDPDVGPPLTSTPVVVARIAADSPLVYARGPGLVEPIHLGREDDLRDRGNWKTIDPGATVTEGNDDDGVGLIIVELEMTENLTDRRLGRGELGGGDQDFTASRTSLLEFPVEASSGTVLSYRDDDPDTASLEALGLPVDRLGAELITQFQVGIRYYSFSSPVAVAVVEDAIRGLEVGLAPNDRDVGAQSSLRITLVPPAGVGNQAPAVLEYSLSIEPVNDPPFAVPADDLVLLEEYEFSPDDFPGRSMEFQRRPFFGQIDTVENDPNGIVKTTVTFVESALEPSSPANVKSVDELIEVVNLQIGSAIDLGLGESDARGLFLTIEVPNQYTYGVWRFKLRLTDDHGTPGDPGDDASRTYPEGDDFFRVIIRNIDTTARFVVEADPVARDEDTGNFILFITGADNGPGDGGFTAENPGTIRVRVLDKSADAPNAELFSRGEGEISLERDEAFYSLAPRFRGNVNGIFTFGVTLVPSDGGVEVTKEVGIVIAPVNDAPRLAMDQDLVVAGIAYNAVTSLKMTIADPDVQARVDRVAPTLQGDFPNGGYAPGSFLSVELRGRNAPPLTEDQAKAIDIGLTSGLGNVNDAITVGGFIIKRAADDRLEFERESDNVSAGAMSLASSRAEVVSSGSNHQRFTATITDNVPQGAMDAFLGAALQVSVDDSDATDRTDRIVEARFHDSGNDGESQDVGPAENSGAADVQIGEGNAPIMYEKGGVSEPIDLGPETELMSNFSAAIDPGATVSDAEDNTVATVIMELALTNAAGERLGGGDGFFASCRFGEASAGGSTDFAYSSVLSALAGQSVPVDPGLGVDLGEELTPGVGLGYSSSARGSFKVGDVQEQIRGVRVRLASGDESNTECGSPVPVDRDIGEHATARITIVPALGGNPQFARQEYSLRITPVNDPPEATTLLSTRDAMIDTVESVNTQTFDLTLLSDADPVETGQSLQALIVRSTLSTVYPDNVNAVDELVTFRSVTVSGVSFAVAPNRYGDLSFWLRLQDSGGTANEGNDSTDFGPYRIRVAPVDNPPRFEFVEPTVSVKEGAISFSFGVRDADNGEGDPDFGIVRRGRLYLAPNTLLYFPPLTADLFRPNLDVDSTIAPHQDTNGEWVFVARLDENDNEPTVSDDNMNGEIESGEITYVDQSTTRELVLVIEPVNDAPVLGLKEVAPSLPPGARAVPLNLTITDPDVEARKREQSDSDVRAREVGWSPVVSRAASFPPHGGYAVGSTLRFSLDADTTGDDAKAIDIDLVGGLSNQNDELTIGNIVITRGMGETLDFAQGNTSAGAMRFTRLSARGASGSNRQVFEATISEYLSAAALEAFLDGAVGVSVDAGDTSAQHDRAIEVSFLDVGNDGVDGMTGPAELSSVVSLPVLSDVPPVIVLGSAGTITENEVTETAVFAGIEISDASEDPAARRGQRQEDKHGPAIAAIVVSATAVSTVQGGLDGFLGRYLDTRWVMGEEFDSVNRNLLGDLLEATVSDGGLVTRFAITRFGPNPSTPVSTAEAQAVLRSLRFVLSPKNDDPPGQISFKITLVPVQVSGINPVEVSASQAWDVEDINDSPVLGALTTTFAIDEGDPWVRPLRVGTIDLVEVDQEPSASVFLRPSLGLGFSGMSRQVKMERVMAGTSEWSIALDPDNNPGTNAFGERRLMVTICDGDCANGDGLADSFTVTLQVLGMADPVETVEGSGVSLRSGILFHRSLEGDPEHGTQFFTSISDGPEESDDLRIRNPRLRVARNASPPGALGMTLSAAELGRIGDEITIEYSVDEAAADRVLLNPGSEFVVQSGSPLGVYLSFREGSGLREHFNGAMVLTFDVEDEPGRDFVSTITEVSVGFWVFADNDGLDFSLVDCVVGDDPGTWCGDVIINAGETSSPIGRVSDPDLEPIALGGQELPEEIPGSMPVFRSGDYVEVEIRERMGGDLTGMTIGIPVTAGGATTDMEGHSSGVTTKRLTFGRDVLLEEAGEVLRRIGISVAEGAFELAALEPVVTVTVVSSGNDGATGDAGPTVTISRSFLVRGDVVDPEPPDNLGVVVEDVGATEAVLVWEPARDKLTENDEFYRLTRTGLPHGGLRHTIRVTDITGVDAGCGAGQYVAEFSREEAEFVDGLYDDTSGYAVLDTVASTRTSNGYENKSGGVRAVFRITRRDATLIPGREYCFELSANDLAGNREIVYEPAEETMDTELTDSDGDNIPDELEDVVDDPDGGGNNNGDGDGDDIGNYCGGGGEFGDADGDGIPNNVEIEIGLECRDGEPGGDITFVGDEPLEIVIDFTGLRIVGGYVIYPGSGPLTEVPVRELGVDCEGGTGVCALEPYRSRDVRNTSCAEDDTGRGSVLRAGAGNCESADSDGDGDPELGSFSRFVLWVARDEAGNWASTEQRVYVRPPVGFDVSRLPVDGESASMPVSVALSDDVVAGSTVTFTVDLAISSEGIFVLTSLDQLSRDRLVELDLLDAATSSLTVKLMIDGAELKIDVNAVPSELAAPMSLSSTELFTLGNDKVELKPDPRDPPVLGVESFALYVSTGVEPESLPYFLVPGGTSDLSFVLFTSPWSWYEVEAKVLAGPSLAYPDTAVATASTRAASGTTVTLTTPELLKAGDLVVIIASTEGETFAEFFVSVVAGDDLKVLDTHAPVGVRPISGLKSIVVSGVTGDQARFRVSGLSRWSGGYAIAASTLSVLLPDVADHVPDVVLEGPPRYAGTGIFDFTVAGLRIGSVASVLIELDEPVSRVQRLHKYDNGWSPFTTGDNAAPFDDYYSAPFPCPSLGARRGSGAAGEWRLASGSGVQAGDSCILVEIRDGSVNDADGVRDGVIHDPSALADGGERRGGGGGALGPAWLLLLALGAAAAARRRNSCNS